MKELLSRWELPKRMLPIICYYYRTLSTLNITHFPPNHLQSRTHPYNTITRHTNALNQKHYTNKGIPFGLFFLFDHWNTEISCFQQKGFSQVTQELTGKALHALWITGVANLGVFYSNTLISMYSKFGHIGYARYVFDNMSERNEASWNNMMSGLVRVGLYRDSFNFFIEMRHSGVNASGFVVASLITAFDRSGFMFREGIQVHCFTLKYGLLCDVFVGTSFVHCYGTYGFAPGAMKFFEEMPEKNVVSWTALMVSFLDYGEPKMVTELYKRMQFEGVGGNANTLASVISSCASLKDYFLGHQVAAHILKFGLETNVSVANSLLSMFSNFGRMQEASRVFDAMIERDIISWNSMISANVRNGLCEESLRCFYAMRHVHNEVNAATLSSLLSGCGSMDYLRWGKGIHCLSTKFGWDSDVCVSNALMGMYSDAGKPEDAELLFKGMEERDLISWNTLLACYAQDGKCQDALKIFITIFIMTKSVNYVTFTSALAACAAPEFISEGRVLHALVTVTGLGENLIVGNALLTVYAKSGFMIEAEKIFKNMSKRDEVTCNALIGGFADDENPDKAVKVFKLMRKHSIPANYITVVNLLGAFSSLNNLLKYGMPIHGFIVRTGFEQDMFVQNSLIMMYAKCEDLDSSNYIFGQLTHKNVCTWNAIIAANAHHGHVEEALKLLVKMKREGVHLDHFGLSESLAATAKMAMLEEGQQLHCWALKLGLNSDFCVQNSTMDMYGKCGEMDDVLRIIHEPAERSRMSWNILISSFARYGCFEKAKETFQEMLNMSVKPDHVTFVSLLSACSHGGLVEEGLAYYDSMTKEFGVPARIEHCVCIVDLLGRSGRLDEAESYINEMPIPPTDLIWRSLLASCKVHGNLELGRKAVEELLKLDPTDDSAYVLYSNVCATSGRWEDLENIRRQMDSSKIKKKPACSWVKLKNRWYSFGIADKSHPQCSQILSKLEELKKIIKEAGYVPDTSYALHDTDEEQKEHNLWNHSEKLALAFGLINTPEGSPVKIFKNLRVCGDCHSVYKFASEVLGRKISLRDSYRFHHFNGGKCSCSDFW